MDFLTVVQNFGLAVALLAVMGVAAWRAAVWFGNQILKPVTDRHIKFLDELSTGMASQSQALQTMAVQQGKNLQGIESLMARMEEMMEKQDHMFRVFTHTEQGREIISQHKPRGPTSTGST